MNETKVDFASAGQRFSGSIFEPENAAARRHAGVVVLHGGAGPGPHERERAERLTELGYAAFVPDLFGEVFETRQWRQVARRRELPWWPPDTGSSRNQRRERVDSRLRRRGGSIRHARTSSGIRRRNGPGKCGLAASRLRERDARLYRTRHSAARLGLSGGGR